MALPKARHHNRVIDQGAAALRLFVRFSAKYANFRLKANLGTARVAEDLAGARKTYKDLDMQHLNSSSRHISDEAVLAVRKVVAALQEKDCHGAVTLLGMAVGRNSRSEGSSEMILRWASEGPDPDELSLYCGKAIVRPIREEVFEGYIDEIVSAFDLVAAEAAVREESELMPA